MLRFLTNAQSLAAVAAHQASVEGSEIAVDDLIPAGRNGRQSPSSAWPGQAYDAEHIPLGPRMFSELPASLAQLAEDSADEQGQPRCK